MPVSEYTKLNKQLVENSKQLSVLEKDNKELKKLLKILKEKSIWFWTKFKNLK